MDVNQELIDKVSELNGEVATVSKAGDAIKAAAAERQQVLQQLGKHVTQALALANCLSLLCEDDFRSATNISNAAASAQDKWVNHGLHESQLSNSGEGLTLMDIQADDLKRAAHATYHTAESMRVELNVLSEESKKMQELDVRATNDLTAITNVAGVLGPSIQEYLGYLRGTV